MFSRLSFIAIFSLLSVAFNCMDVRAFVNIDIDKITKNVSSQIKNEMKTVVDNTVKDVQSGIDQKVGDIQQTIDNHINGINDKIIEMQKTFHLIVNLLIVLVSAIGLIIAILVFMMLIKIYGLVRSFYERKKLRLERQDRGI